jgi:hypothetical protein
MASSGLVFQDSSDQSGPPAPRASVGGVRIGASRSASEAADRASTGPAPGPTERAWAAGLDAGESNRELKFVFCTLNSHAPPTSTGSSRRRPSANPAGGGRARCRGARTSSGMR